MEEDTAEFVSQGRSLLNLLDSQLPVSAVNVSFVATVSKANSTPPLNQADIISTSPTTGKLSADGTVFDNPHLSTSICVVICGRSTVINTPLRNASGDCSHLTTYLRIQVRRVRGGVGG